MKCTGNKTWWSLFERAGVSYPVCWVTFTVSLLTSASRAVCSLPLQPSLLQSAPFAACEVHCVSLLCRSGLLSSSEILRMALCVCSAGKSCLELKFWGKSYVENGLLAHREEQVCVCAHQRRLLLIRDLFPLERETWGSPSAALSGIFDLGQRISFDPWTRLLQRSVTGAEGWSNRFFPCSLCCSAGTCCFSKIGF